jgi:hypothetical protein
MSDSKAHRRHRWHNSKRQKPVPDDPSFCPHEICVKHHVDLLGVVAAAA